MTRNKLAVPQKLQKFPPFYGTPKFITALTSPHHPPLIWAKSTQSTPSQPISSKIHRNIILPSTPRFSKWSLWLRFHHQIHACTSPLPHACHMPRPLYSSRFDDTIIFSCRSRNVPTVLAKLSDVEILKHVSWWILFITNWRTQR